MTKRGGKRARRTIGPRAAGEQAVGSGTWLDRASTWLIPGSVLILTLVTYLPALTGDFLNWDDDQNFLKNLAYRGLDPANVRWMFTTFHLGPYQPLSWLTLGVDYVIWGMDPYGYHLTSVLIHVANAWLVYLLALRVFSLIGADRRLSLIGAGRFSRPSRSAARTAAGVAALVFAIHPLRVESVAWVTERRDVLSGLFALLTLLAYLKAAALARDGLGGRRWLTAAVVFFACSLGSKAAALALPLVLILVDVWILRRLDPDTNAHPSSVRSLLWEKVPFAVLAAGAAWLAIIGQRLGTALASPGGESILVRVAHGAYGLMFGVKKSIVPLELSNLYEVPFRANPFDAHFVWSAAGVVSLTLAAFLWRRRLPAVFVAWTSYLLLLLPVSGIAHPGGEIVADRYTYLPGIVLALLAAGGALVVWGAAAARRIRPLAARAVSAATFGVLVILFALSARQIRVWHDSLTLWQHAFAIHPLEQLRASGAPASDVRAYEARLATLGALSSHRLICVQLGLVLRAAGRQEDAVDVFARGAAASPSDADIRNNWAGALLDLRRIDEAADVLETSIRLDPAHAEAQFNLAIARTSQGRTEDAMAAYGRAIAIDGANPVAHYNLGVLMADAGRPAEAAAEYQRAIALRPDYAEAYNNLGVVLGRQDRISEAIDAFRQAATLDPSNASARQNLSRALAAAKGGR